MHSKPTRPHLAQALTRRDLTPLSGAPWLRVSAHLFARLTICSALTHAMWAQGAQGAPASGPTSASTAAPARLAVLEIQGALGSVEERQAWSDAMRAIALERLVGRGVAVIDRAQFELLLPPSSDLSECVGMCEAQVARAVGARWSLSARLAAQGGDDLWIVTLKLHAFDGALLRVVQRASLSVADVPEALSSLTAEALAPLAPLERDLRAPLASSQVSSPTPPTALEPPLAPSPSPEPPSLDEAAAWTHSAAGLRWRRVGAVVGAQCVSERVTVPQYGRCVAAGRCSPAARGGRCPSEGSPGWALQTCVDAQQAVAFAAYVGAQVASEPDLLALYGACPACAQPRGGAWEWALTPSDGLALSGLSASALRAAPKRLTLRASPLGRRALPPAFQLPEVSFRLVRGADGEGAGACEGR